MTPEQVLQAALDTTGVNSDGGVAWPGLVRLIDAFGQERELTDIAPLAFYGNCGRKLQNFLALDELARQRSPSPLPDTVVILGLPRSGSTLLHNLLALESGTGYGRHFEMTNSWWMLGNTSREDAWADVQNRLDLLDALNPNIRDLHPSAAEWPDECTLIFEAAFASHQWPVTYGLPAYMDWLSDLDWEPYYQYYRKVLPAVIVGGTERIVLKSPAHTLHHVLLRQALPQAKWVQTVRSSSDVIPSWLSLVRSLYEVMHKEDRLPAQLVERWTTYLEAVASASIGLADAGTPCVQFDDLVGDPIQTIGVLLRGWGRDLTEDHIKRMRIWLDSTEAKRRGHHYGFEDVATQSKRSAAFGTYDHRFGPVS